jgi:hypothetical protein
MIYVQIGDQKRNLDDAIAPWINEQLARRKANGSSTCVQVFVQTSGMNVVFATPDCGGGGGGGALNPQEQQLAQEWRKHGLSDPNYNVGNLVSFLRHLQRNT